MSLQDADSFPQTPVQWGRCYESAGYRLVPPRPCTDALLRVYIAQRNKEPVMI